jgi:hypothetical protein
MDGSVLGIVNCIANCGLHGVPLRLYGARPDKFWFQVVDLVGAITLFSSVCGPCGLRAGEEGWSLLVGCSLCYCCNVVCCIAALRWLCCCALALLLMADT